MGFLTKGKLLCVCPHVADFGLILKYRLELKLEVLTRKRVVHAMLAGVCEDVCIHKIEDELSSNIRVPIIQDLKIDNRFVKAGDFLGLNSISELIKQNKT